MSEQRGTASSGPGARQDRRYEATDVRQGEIVLRTPWRRAIFIGGLVGIVLLPFLMWLIAG